MSVIVTGIINGNKISIPKHRNEPTPDFKGRSFVVIEGAKLAGKGLISNVSYSEDMDILDVISYRKDGFIANDGHIEIAILIHREG